MGVVVNLNYPESPDSSKQNNRVNLMRNKDRGFTALYRSLLDDDWTRDAFLFSAWVRMLLRASSTERTVNYNNNDWSIGRGQLVIIPGRFASELCDRNGRPVSRDAVVRMLKFFESQNMIVTAGYDKGTVITICNYDAYQSLITPVLPAQATAQHGAQDSAHHEAFCDKGLSDTPAQAAAYATAQQSTPEEQPCKTTKINNQDQEQETLGSGTAIAEPNLSDVGERLVAESDIESEKIPTGAALHKRSGKKLLWGTAEDVQTATWFINRIAKVYQLRGLDTPKRPDLIAWTNDIRLMRENDNRSHHDICQLFDWVCKTGRELEFCQSPKKLRDDWDKLSLRMANSTSAAPVSRGLSNVAAAQLAAREAKAAGVGLYDDNTIL